MKKEKGDGNMNLEEIKQILCREDLEKILHFTRKTRSHYISYSPEVEETIFDDLLLHINRYLEPFIGMEQIEFNPTGYRDDTIETCDLDYLGNYQEVISSFDVGNVENIEDEADNFSFYCIDVKARELGINVKFFRRVTKFKRLYSKGLLAAFQGNRLNKVKDKMLGLDGNIDLIIYNEEVAILNHTSLERIFRLEDQYLSKAAEAIECLRASSKIVNFEEFEDDCMNDLRVRKVLTRMLGEEASLYCCFDNFDNVVDTINIFGLDIEIQRSPVQRIIYEDKRQVMDILRLARDSYYRSLVRERHGIDNKI